MLNTMKENSAKINIFFFHLKTHVILPFWREKFNFNEVIKIASNNRHRQQIKHVK